MFQEKFARYQIFHGSQCSVGRKSLLVFSFYDIFHVFTMNPIFIRLKVKQTYHTYVLVSTEHLNSYLGPQSIQPQLIYGQLVVS